MKNNFKLHRQKISDRATIIAFILFSLFLSRVYGQSWMQLNNVGSIITGTSSSGPPITNALSLSINGKIYVVGNRTFTTTTTNAMMWEYDPLNDSWAEKSMYPGNGSSFLCGFTIGGLAYIGCGTGTVHANTDFYKYNPGSNTWTALANVPVARSMACGFAIGGKGYLTCGSSTNMSVYLNDLWEYDTTSNGWSAKANFPGTVRIVPSAFSSSSFGFVGLGFSYGVSATSDFYKYDPASNSWSPTSAFPGTARSGAGAVVVSNHAVIICGNSAMNFFNTCYAYDMQLDSWSNYPSFPGTVRTLMICGSSNHKIFAGGGTGQSGSVVFEDWWNQQSSLSVGDETKNGFCRAFVYKDICEKTILRVESKEINNVEYEMYDSQLKLMSKGKVSYPETILPDVTNGMYTITFKSQIIKPVRFCF
jgi:N-acetylneuraminic acid mutarotase